MHLYWSRHCQNSTSQRNDSIPFDFKSLAANFTAIRRHWFSCVSVCILRLCLPQTLCVYVCVRISIQALYVLVQSNVSHQAKEKKNHNKVHTQQRDNTTKKTDPQHKSNEVVAAKTTVKNAVEKIRKKTVWQKSFVYSHDSHYSISSWCRMKCGFHNFFFFIQSTHFWLVNQLSRSMWELTLCFYNWKFLSCDAIKKEEYALSVYAIFIFHGANIFLLFSFWVNIKQWTVWKCEQNLMYKYETHKNVMKR